MFISPQSPIPRNRSKAGGESPPRPETRGKCPTLPARPLDDAPHVPPMLADCEAEPPTTVDSPESWFPCLGHRTRGKRIIRKSDTPANTSLPNSDCCCGVLWRSASESPAEKRLAEQTLTPRKAHTTDQSLRSPSAV